MQRVLSVGYALAPFKERNAVLAAAGLAVREAIGLVQALRMIEDEEFDVVVLGAALSTEDRNRIAQVTRRRKCNSKIIMLYDGRITGTELADAIIAADDPQRVVDTIRLFGDDAKSASECA
jgi:PleD family two-component response regulator